nr:MAG TPA: hypothetical protein [Caudoviricetes sp.]
MPGNVATHRGWGSTPVSDTPFCVIVSILKLCSVTVAFFIRVGVCTIAALAVIAATACCASTDVQRDPLTHTSGYSDVQQNE